jgi:hypothetical protein
VEAITQAVFETVDSSPPEKVGLCEFRKLTNTLKLNKGLGFDGIPNQCLRNLSRKPLAHIKHLFNHCFRVSHFPQLLKEAKIIILNKPGKDPNFKTYF